MKSHGSLRILMLAWNYPPALGGIEDVAAHLAGSLRLEGMSLQVLARCGAEDEEMDVARPKKAGLCRYLAFSFFRGFRYVLHQRPDVIICPGIVDAPVGLLLARLSRRPILLLAHGSDIAHGGRIYRAVASFLFRTVDAISANSANTIRLLSELGCKTEKVRLIHPGIDADSLRVDDAGKIDLRSRKGFGDNRILLSAGRVIRRKGIHLFVEKCLPLLVKEFPELRYIIAGGDASDSLVHKESLLDEIRQTVDDAGLQQHVIITGKVTDDVLQEYYQMAEVFLMPAIEIPGDVEGFGIVFLEAAAAGVPAVATVCGGIPEAVVHNQTGVLVAPEDWPALQKAVMSLLQDETYRLRLGRAARKRVVEQFDWSHIGGQYVAYVEELSGGGREDCRL